MDSTSGLGRMVALASLTTLLSGCYDNNYYSQLALQALGGPNTIGSTVVGGGDQNPYGLDVAWVSLGLVAAGDLIICNFNDTANTQGAGTSLLALHPNTGATPILIVQDSSLKGCSAVAALPDGNIVVAASQANKLQLVSPSGVISTPYAADTFHNPWGVAFADTPAGRQLYVSNSTQGTIDRIVLNADDTQASFTEIATGFTATGAPGSIAAPSGLTYDDTIDTLYIVDTGTNTVLAFNNVSTIGADGVSVTVNAGADSFSGPNAASAHVIAHGAPLNGPISAALLASGNLIVGNTLDPNGTNLLLEISPGSGVLYTRNVDTGNAGAIFGIAIEYDAYGNVAIFFNDDNSNTLQGLF